MMLKSIHASMSLGWSSSELLLLVITSLIFAVKILLAVQTSEVKGEKTVHENYCSTVKGVVSYTELRDSFPCLELLLSQVVVTRWL